MKILVPESQEMLTDIEVIAAVKKYKAAKATQEKLRRKLHAYMTRSGETKIKTEHGTVSLTKEHEQTSYPKVDLEQWARDNEIFDALVKEVSKTTTVSESIRIT